MSTGNTLLAELEDLYDGVIATKAAEASASAGHVQNQGDAGTSHPSKSEDDGTQEATEGERSSENTADVKSDVPGQSVDEASEDKMEGESEHPLTEAKPTGEDPANETQSADGLIGGDAGKDHAGKDTKHPAKVDFGGKYASVATLIRQGQTKMAAVTLQRRINDFNASVAALQVPEKVKEALAAEKKAAASPGDGEGGKTEAPPAEKLPSGGAPPADKSTEGGEGGTTKESSHKCPSCDKMYEGDKCSCGYSGESGDMPYDKKGSADEKAGRDAAKVAAAELGLTSDPQDQADLVAAIVKRALDDANMYADFMDDFEKGAAAANQEAANKKSTFVGQIREWATTSRNNVKNAMENQMAGADMLAQGGESEEPGAIGEGAGAAGGEGMGGGGIDPAMLEQIIAELEQAGIDPEMLAQLDPADLAQALAEAEGGGMEGGGMEGGMEGGEGMMPPQEGAAPELAPAAAM